MPGKCASEVSVAESHRARRVLEVSRLFVERVLCARISDCTL